MIDNNRLLNRFLEYIQIDSETGFEREMQERVIAELTAAGIYAVADNCGEKVDSTGNNVYARLDGDVSLEPIVFSSHMDTVTPGKGIKPIIEDGIIKSDGTTILGGDDKCGVASIVETLITLKEQGIPHRTVEAVLTVREESGMYGAKAFDCTKLKSRMGVVLDSGGDVGTIITTAPGQLRINATILGKPSHAGVAPEAGISAIQVAAHAIAKMKLLRVDHETTANIGTIIAESPTNIVTEKCNIFAEARSINYEKLVAQGDHMRACLQEACDNFGATLEIDISTSYVGYDTPAEAPVLKFVSDKMKEMGVEVKTMPTGGGSDANIFRERGIDVLNLGVGMDKVHSKNEQLAVKQLENTCELLYRLAQK